MEKLCVNGCHFQYLIHSNLNIQTGVRKPKNPKQQPRLVYANVISLHYGFENAFSTNLREPTTWRS